MAASHRGGRLIGLMLVVGSALGTAPSQAADEFPFGLEMTLDTAPMAGSKRRPTLEVGDSGDTRVELWCKGGVGQFSVAGETVIFVPGTMEARSCTPVQMQADDALLATLAEAVTWKRQGDAVTFAGPKSLRFRINTN